MMRRLPLCIAVAAATVALPAAQQQTPPQQQPPVPVFRAEARVVPLTVTVTDQQGRPVTGLTQADFKVFEDSREREIVNFFAQSFPPGAVTEPVMDAANGRAGIVAPATRRTFLIVLGNGFIQEPTRALDGAMTFVRERLLPQDAVAVMAFHRATAFTTDHAAIATMLQHYKNEHIKILDLLLEHRLRTVSPGSKFGTGGRAIPEALLSDIDRRLFEGVLPRESLRNASDLLLGMDLGAASAPRPWQPQARLSDVLESLDKIGVSLTDAVIVSSRLKIYAAIEYMRFIEGDKHIVMLDRNMYPPLAWSADDARILAARANGARVVVDYVWTYGTSSRNSGCQPCRDVVEGTGGSYTSVDYMDQALSKIDERTRSSYLLGYAPVTAQFDGKYRQVRVEVKRPGATVAFRHGYFATEEPTPLDAQELARSTRRDGATAYAGEATDVRLEVKASVALSRETRGQETNVEIKVDVASLGLQALEGLRTGALEVSVYCGDAKEAIVGESKVRWNLRADEATYADWLKSGFTRTISVPVKAPPKFVKVIAYDLYGDKFGSKTVTISR